MRLYNKQYDTNYLNMNKSIQTTTEYSKYKLTKNGKVFNLSQKYTNLNAAKYEIRKVNKLKQLNNEVIIF